MTTVRAAAVAGLLLVCACGDRAPPALWPEPPPPTLAHPIGIADPQSLVATSGSDGSQPGGDGDRAERGAVEDPASGVCTGADDGSSGNPASGSTGAVEPDTNSAASDAPAETGASASL